MEGAELEIRVVRDGRELTRITRLVRVVRGQRAVRYRGNLYPVRHGPTIDVGQPALNAQGESEAARNSVETGQADTGASASTEIPADWDAEQLAVITADSRRRLLVDAGPGTGKTAVACRRVAELINEQNIPASNIWLISFTRTAVQEIKGRLRHYLNDPAHSSGVSIATIDSHAWAIHSGFDEHASLTGTYEENISRVTEMIRSHDGVFEYLESVQHVVIDEAQDIVGPRADLIMTLLDNLRPECGVTLFADEAQAIYGWADDNGGSREISEQLLQQLRTAARFGFHSCSLTKIRRAATATLHRLFTDVRRLVLDREIPSNGNRFSEVRQAILKLADQHASRLDEVIEPHARGNTLVLFRRRADTLVASSFRDLEPHSLRMSGFPTVVEPWLASVFWDFTATRISQSDFEQRWGARVAQDQLTTLHADPAWQLLVRLAGESRTTVSLEALRKKLGRLSPPLEVCRLDFGLPGPVFGTIHGSKGREADNVVLMMPANRSSSNGKNSPDEEARVLFVGATRARRRLIVVDPYGYARTDVTESGRVYVLRTGDEVRGRAQVEIGRANDLSAEGLVGRSSFASAREAQAGQQWLLRHANRMESAKAEAEQRIGFRYRVCPDDGGAACVAVLDQSLNSDLFEIGGEVARAAQRQLRLKPPDWFLHLRLFGARSLVLPPGPSPYMLHEPWASSGFMLAPLVQAFTMIQFRKY